MRVILTQCVKEKSDSRKQAKDLYTSDYFVKQRQYAELRGDEWYILSAEHGLVHPDQELDPYDRHIDSVKTPIWGEDVAEDLNNLYDDATIVFLGGKKYTEPVEKRLSDSLTVEKPLSGLNYLQRRGRLTELLFYHSGITKVYVASRRPHDYPFKLSRPHEMSQRVVDLSESFIIDSGIGDDFTNQQIIKLANKYDPEFVIPKDYLHDQEATTESVNEFLDMYDGDATPLIPLQPPHHEHYESLPGHSHYALGGMAGNNTSTTEIIRHIERFNSVAPPSTYIHGLGIGADIQFIRRVAGKGLLDSIDTSTPDRAATNGRVMDQELSKTEVRIKTDAGVDKRTEALSKFNCWQVQDAWEREHKKNQQRTDGLLDP